LGGWGCSLVVTWLPSMCRIWVSFPVL
jgi:hypothetical protein